MQDAHDADYDDQLERLLEDVVKLAASRKRPMRPVTVLIDGPSGAGKTWASASLADRTGWRVVHLDEFYPCLLYTSPSPRD